MKKIFIYWDNSNIFIEAQNLADEMNHDSYARYRVRLHFENLLLLAHANRPVEKAYAVGSIPPGNGWGLDSFKKSGSQSSPSL